MNEYPYRYRRLRVQRGEPPESDSTYRKLGYSREQMEFHRKARAYVDQTFFVVAGDLVPADKAKDVHFERPRDGGETRVDCPDCGAELEPDPVEDVEVKWEEDLKPYELGCECGSWFSPAWPRSGAELEAWAESEADIFRELAEMEKDSPPLPLAPGRRKPEPPDEILRKAGRAIRKYTP